MELKNLNDFAAECHFMSTSKGFYEGGYNFGERVALIHSEISEALEAHRNNKEAGKDSAYLALQIHDDEEFKEFFKANVKDTVEDEIADALIRSFDLCGKRRTDIHAHVLAKMRYNSLRPHKHGKNY